MIRFILIVLLTAQIPLKADDCSNRLSQCKLVIDDYKLQVDLLQQRGVLLERQRDDAVKQAASPVLPGYFWVLTGVLAGSIAVLYIKK